MNHQTEKLDPSTRRMVWLMVAVMSLSFVFGIAMFIPAEHRADKLDEMMARYQARNPEYRQNKPRPLNQPEW
ncbi:MAG: hypothetical protein OEZ23_03130 [Gammaproteobacteria bacterium]|nr:hypothetical protein [Gammaproteobacteria bacterium]